MSDLQWWGYLHTNGSIQVKRYFDTRDLSEARESPFVKKITETFEAVSREQAEAIATEILLPKLKPGTYNATVKTVEVLENGNVNMTFAVEGRNVTFNIYKET